MRKRLFFCLMLLLLSIIIFSSCVSGGAPGRAQNEDGTTAETVKKSEVDPVEKVSAWLVTRDQWIPTCDLVASGGKGTGSFWWLTVSRAWAGLGDDEKICLSVFIADTDDPGDIIRLNYDPVTQTYIYPDRVLSEITEEIMYNRNPALLDTWSLIGASETKKDGKDLTEQEIKEATDFYSECRALAEQDAVYVKVRAVYDRVVSENTKKIKERLSGFTAQENLFIDYGFEIAARCGDESVLGGCLLRSQCAFAVIGTKKMFSDFVQNVIPDGREEKTGMFVAFGPMPDPSTSLSY